MVAALIAGMAMVCVLGVFIALVGGGSTGSVCGSSAGGAAPITLAPPGVGETVGASEYGGPGDPSSGDIGSSGTDLYAEPDSYAELGGTTFATATAMGGLPYGTPLRVSWGRHSVIAYKRDIGLGGGPIDGYPRVIDLWWQLAGALRIPYEGGEWSGPVRVERTAATGAANVLGQAVQSSGAGTAAVTGAAGDGAAGDGVGGDGTAGDAAAADGAACDSSGVGAVPVTDGPRAVLAPDGQAEAPANAPAAVKGIIAAGNEIAGKPYVYGGGHGLPLSEVAPAYDCSSSVSHLLWGGGLLPVTTDMVAADYETWGDPGPGKWVTIYASADHVFMYVAGLRWDTHNAAGPDDGSTGIGWHPLVREADGFVVRHPPGL